MSEWDDWAEEQRQRNFRRQQQEEWKRSNETEAKMVGESVGGIIGLFFMFVGFALVVAFYVLKCCLIFLVFLRNKFFIHWNWYVKIENAVHKVLLWIKNAIELFFGFLILSIFVFPFIILFKYFDLWLVVGAAFLYYHYGK